MGAASSGALTPGKCSSCRLASPIRVALGGFREAYCDGCSVGVVAGGAHAGRVGEHGAVDALARLHHGPVAHGAHAGPSGSGM
ncbi:hypothetical protein EYF80_047692 [Liparis tanakae]|uniref:Uncharacterized protein n=1 Tax=Liparis tanakae TaxID=230148 RepID=A0A4Z2FLW0_9TELE|nr:hypothetical protein EYF80_047692 [Liparis tanakae]